MSRIALVLAPNPGPFTLEGTNTWVVGSPPCLVIDPGPDNPGHREAVLAQAGDVGMILLTHHHPDHAEGAARLGAQAGAPVRAFHPGPNEGPIADGEVIRTAGQSIRAIHTPGHTDDHLVFLELATGSLFTGDAVLGRGTSVIDPPEGDMAAYMGSIGKMIGLRPVAIYPGHGPVVSPALPKLQYYLEHRRDRERQVLAALADEGRTPEELVQQIYQGYPQSLHAAAARSILAHLLKLEREDRVEKVGPPGTERYALHRPGLTGD